VSAGLGRTGRLIEAAISSCATLQLMMCPLGYRRANLVAEYAESRKTVIEQRWHLEVQREAMGLHLHIRE